MIDDFNAQEVRLAKLNATDTASVKGAYYGIVDDHVIVRDGATLEALSRTGTLTKLGRLAVVPNQSGPDTVVLNPNLSQWLYATTDNNWTAEIHLGSATSDKIIATIPSPDGNAFYRPFAWNASGIYMVRQPVGLGGAGPFLEYHFALATFDMKSGHVADVAPSCIAYNVLDDGTMICGQASTANIEIRSPSGKVNVIKVATGAGTDAAFIDLVVSSDNKRLLVARNGSKDPVINYQMAVADLTSSSAKAFGSLDYTPGAWLPDGRVVAAHACAYSGWGGGPCDTRLDGTYLFSANGTSHSLFFKLTHGSVVGYI